MNTSGNLCITPIGLIELLTRVALFENKFHGSALEPTASNDNDGNVEVSSTYGPYGNLDVGIGENAPSTKESVTYVLRLMTASGGRAKLLNNSRTGFNLRPFTTIVREGSVSGNGSGGNMNDINTTNY